MTMDIHSYVILQIFLLTVFVSTVSGMEPNNTTCNISSSNGQEKMVTCELDPGKIGVSLYIYNLKPGSGCEMKMNSKLMRNITVTSKSLLSFRGCNSGDVQATAQRIIECSDLKNCSNPFLLNVPALPSGFPANLSRATWTLRPPRHGTVRLNSPTESLKQNLPNQPCNDSFFIEMAEEKDGHPIGRFCSQGSIKTIFIQASVTITWSPKLEMGGVKSLLVAAFENEIKETYIFHVSPPLEGTPVLIASPGWPVGIKNDSTISWIVTFPKKQEAILKFFNKSQHTCSKLHTSIVVQRIGCLEEDYSRREDEETSEKEIIVSKNFYLNMSNCITKEGDFTMIAYITLQMTRDFILTIILSVVAVLVVVSTAILVVVCIMIRKKKKLSHEVSIYNSGGTNFHSGQNGLANSELDRDSHIYNYIDDTLVYTHLMKKGQKDFNEEDDDSQCIKRHKENLLTSQHVDDNKESYRFSLEGPPLPSRPLSHNLSLMSSETEA